MFLNFLCLSAFHIIFSLCRDVKVVCLLTMLFKENKYIPKKKKKTKQNHTRKSKGKILKKKIIMVTLSHMWNLAKHTSLRSSPFEQKTLFSSAQLEKHKLTLVCFHVHTRKAEGRGGKSSTQHKEV